MEPEEQNLETLLDGLRPAGLDARLMDRLELAISGRLLQAPADPFETKLKDMQPSLPRQQLRERLEAVVAGVPFPVDEKVVLFPRGSAAGSAASPRRRPWAAIAAAVAILGALSAVFVGPPDAPARTAAKQSQAAGAPTRAKVESGTFVPAGYRSDVSDTHDMGVTWSGDHQPVRVVRVIYRDRVSFLNSKGERIELEVPRVELMMVPEKID